MKRIQYFGIMLALSALLTACGGDSATTGTEDGTDQGLDTTQFLADLNILETKINSDLDIPKEKDLKEALTKYQDFAAIFPEDPKAAEYLLKASDLALTLDQPQKSVKILNQIINGYPDYEKIEDVKYNRASHLDFELRDTTKAKEAYQEFMVEYPNSPLVSDCESRIKNIRYSMEELTQKFIDELEANGTGDLVTP